MFVVGCRTLSKLNHMGEMSVGYDKSWEGHSEHIISCLQGKVTFTPDMEALFCFKITHLAS